MRISRSPGPIEKVASLIRTCDFHYTPRILTPFLPETCIRLHATNSEKGRWTGLDLRYVPLLRIVRMDPMGIAKSLGNVVLSHRCAAIVKANYEPNLRSSS
jgi:hypothetical protein